MPTVSELRDFCKLTDVPDAIHLREESNPAAQALAIVEHCEKIGPLALSSLEEAIRCTEGQEQLRAAALEALRMLAKSPPDLRSRALRWRDLAVRHGLPALASALVIGFLLWLPGRARSLTLGRQLAVCDSAARDDRLTPACLEVIAHAARHLRPVAAGGITRLAMQPKLEKATRHELFRLAKMLDPRADFPMRSNSALRREFREVQVQDPIPDWTDAVVILARSDDRAASKVRNKLLGQAPVISSLRFDLRHSLPDGHDVLDVLLHATGARAIVGRDATEWVAATRALGVERMLQMPLPHFQSAEPAPAHSLDSFLFAGQALEAAQTAANRGDLTATAERLQEASKQCGGSCSLAGVISACTELAAIGLGQDALAEAALKQLDSPDTAQDHYLKALGRLVWQLLRGEVRSTEAQTGDWFDPIKQEALLRNVDERSRSLLITLAEGAKAVADLRQATIIWSVGRAHRPDRSDPFKNVGVLPSKPKQPQPPIQKALELLNHIGWRDAALLIRSAAAPASSDETVGAELVLAIEQMSAKAARHLLPTTSLLVLPMAFYRSEDLSAAEWDRALSSLVAPLAQITRNELQARSPARVAQRLAMWLSMSNYILSDEKLLGEVMDALAVSALADNSFDEYDVGQLASYALLFLPVLSQQTSMSDLTALLTWIEKFEKTQGRKFPVAGAAANLVLAAADVKNSRPAAAHDRLGVGLELMAGVNVPKDSFQIWIGPALRYADALALALDQNAEEAKKALSVAASDMDKQLVGLINDPGHKQECQRISSNVHELAQVWLDLLSKSMTNRVAISRIAALAKRLATSDPAPQQQPFGLAAARLALNALVYGSAFSLGDASDPSLALLIRQAGSDIDNVLSYLPQNTGGPVGRFARSLLAAGQTALAASVTTDTRLQEEALEALQKLLDEVAPATGGPVPVGASRADRLVDLQLGAARVALDVLRRDRVEKWSPDKLWSVMAERLMGYLGSSLKSLGHNRGVLPTMLRVAQGALQSTLDNQTAAARAKLDDALTTDVDELKGPLEILRAELELANGGDAATALDLATKALAQYPSWRVPLHLVRARAHDKLRQFDKAREELHAASGALQDETMFGRALASVEYRSSPILPRHTLEGGDIPRPMRTIASMQASFDFLARLQNQKAGVAQMGVGFEYGDLRKSDDEYAKALPTTFSPKFAQLSLQLADAVHLMLRGDEARTEQVLAGTIGSLHAAMSAARGRPAAMEEIPVDLVLWTAAIADVHGHLVSASQLYGLAASLQPLGGAPTAKAFESPPWILSEISGLKDSSRLLEHVATLRLSAPEQKPLRTLLTNLILGTTEAGSAAPPRMVQAWARSLEASSDLPNDRKDSLPGAWTDLIQLERDPATSVTGLAERLVDQGYETELVRVFDALMTREDPSLAELLTKHLPTFPCPWLLRPYITAAVARLLRDGHIDQLSGLADALQVNPNLQSDDAMAAVALLTIHAARSKRYEPLAEALNKVLSRELHPAVRTRLKILLHAASTLAGEHPEPLSSQATLGIRSDDDQSRAIATYLSKIQKLPPPVESAAGQLIAELAQYQEASWRLEHLPRDPDARSNELRALAEPNAASAHSVRVRALAALGNLAKDAHKTTDALAYYQELLHAAADDPEIKAQVLEALIELAPKTKQPSGWLEDLIKERVSFYKQRGPTSQAQLVDSYLAAARFYASEIRLKEADDSIRQALALARSMPRSTPWLRTAVFAYASIHHEDQDPTAALRGLIAEEQEGQQAEHEQAVLYGQMALFETLRTKGDVAGLKEHVWPLIEESLRQKRPQDALTAFRGALDLVASKANEEALAFIDHALEIALREKCHELEYTASMAKVRLWRLAQNAPRAVEALEYARKAASRMGSAAGIAESYVQLSSDHFKFGQLDLARQEALFALEAAQTSEEIRETYGLLEKSETAQYQDMLLEVLEEFTQTFSRWKNEDLLSTTRIMAAEKLRLRKRYNDAERYLVQAEADAAEREEPSLRAGILARMYDLYLERSGCEGNSSRCEEPLKFAAIARDRCESDREYHCAYQFEDVRVRLLSAVGNVDSWLTAARAMHEKYPLDLKARANYAQALLVANRYQDALALAETSGTSDDCGYAVVLRGVGWAAAQLAGVEPERHARSLLATAEQCRTAVRWSFAEAMSALKASQGARAVDQLERTFANLTDNDVKARQAKLRGALRI